jgi:flavin-binding protein dodecin
MSRTRTTHRLCAYTGAVGANGDGTSRRCAGSAEAITTAGGSVRDIRVAEVTKQDIVVGDGGGLVYRTKIQLSFKYVSE